MKVTLQVNGRKTDFSEQELTDIVEKHFSKMPPREGVWFEVKPLTIDQSFFVEKRTFAGQEEIRQLILEAFREVEKRPEKYGRNFKTMMPKKDWESATIAELKEIASDLGDHMAIWVEQALEWAQRIANGESWMSVCNGYDTADWYRAVEWKNRCGIRLVGGSAGSGNRRSATNFTTKDRVGSDKIRNTVPLVVAYDEEQSAS